MEKMWLFMCLLAVLGSQGIVVKCAAAIFLRSVDWPLWRHKVHSFFFIRTIFIKTLRLRFAPKFKKMYGLK